MAYNASEESLQTIRAIVGSGPSDMDLMRSLHLARNNTELAINILFDTPGFTSGQDFNVKRTTAGSGARVSTAGAQCSAESTHVPTSGAHMSILNDCISSSDPSMNALTLSKKLCCKQEISSIATVAASSVSSVAIRPLKNGASCIRAQPISCVPDKIEKATEDLGTQSMCETEFKDSLLEARDMLVAVKSPLMLSGPNHHMIDHEWCYVGEAEVVGFSTCKGSKLRVGDAVSFSFPKQFNVANGAGARVWGRGRGRATASNSEIVRFSTRLSGEIGRLPGDWARCLVPLVSSSKVKVDGFCKASPETLSLMANVILSVRIYASQSLFKRQHGHPSSSLTSSAEGTVHPLPSLFRLLGKVPFQKAEFTPDDLYRRKRSLEIQGAGTSALSVEKRMELASGARQQENDQGEEVLSDSDVDRLVGVSDSRELEEMKPPNTLGCDLRPYQRQALHWMTKLESGVAIEKAARTLHPCWEAYHLPDKHVSYVYLNVFSGEATTVFPSALQLSRGGILADAMGLGKTVMAIALIIANPGRGGMNCWNKADATKEASTQMKSVIDPNVEADFVDLDCDEDDANQNLWHNKKIINNLKKGGGTLIVCPMTLLGQWKTEIETHVKPGVASIYAHYGTNRTRDSRVLLEYDVVLTTYGVLASEFQNEIERPLHSIHWYRVVLDEAHTIKASKSQSAQAAFHLTADRRWCLTGTPIQNKLEDAFSLLHFLRVEPWSNWGWWNKLVQRPFEEGDERGLKLLQAILRPLMLRRTKDSTDKEGRPILVLPPSDTQVVHCELSEAEQDFYTALFKKSKVKFDRFVEQGKVLHNYASILELLLRLRQCCDHPFLVLSRGDTGEYADLNKLARHFLDEGQRAGEEATCSVPTKAYIKEVVEDLRRGERTECPICLEAVEDAVLTPCAHCLCRECLFGSWRNSSGGPCPICRQYMGRQDIITAPTENRFRIDIEKNWTDSSKVATLMRELEALQLLGAKSIVFSQWTAFLDLLQVPFKRKKFSYVRLDGTLNQQQREKVIKDFSSNPKILVMLVSLKAGGVGINLTAASTVFLLDPWWNPAVEEQAVMRIHRIGQTKAVSIKRFITKGTVEERMQQVQARKQRMIAGALTDQEVRTARIEELKMLFR
eukprot:c25378_g1_i1 orf=73-3459(+)